MLYFKYTKSSLQVIVIVTKQGSVLVPFFDIIQSFKHLDSVIIILLYIQ